MNIIEKMNALYPEMSKTEQQVYRFVNKDPGVVIQYTIKQIAMMSGTSVSAVQRFTKILGFNGYKDFRYAVMSWKESQEEADDTDLIGSLAVSFSDSVKELADIDRRQVRALCKAILAADKVIILGRYRNKTIAEKLAMNLNDLGITCICADDLIGYQHTLYITNEHTCVIIFSAIGEIDDVKDFLQQLATVTKHVWLVTNNKKPKMGKFIEKIIVLPSVYTAFSHPISSHLVMMAFAEILTICAGKHSKAPSSAKA